MQYHVLVKNNNISSITLNNTYLVLHANTMLCITSNKTISCITRNKAILYISRNNTISCITRNEKFMCYNIVILHVILFTQILKKEREFSKTSLKITVWLIMSDKIPWGCDSAACLLIIKLFKWINETCKFCKFKHLTFPFVFEPNQDHPSVQILCSQRLDVTHIASLRQRLIQKPPNEPTSHLDISRYAQSYRRHIISSSLCLRSIFPCD